VFSNNAGFSGVVSASTHFVGAFLSRNFDQNFPKMRYYYYYFLKKAVESRSVGAPWALLTPTLFLPPTVTTLLLRVSIAYAFN